MSITIEIEKHEKPIIDAEEDWKTTAGPKSASQWKPGYSAAEFAHFVLERKEEFRNLISSILSLCNLSTDQKFEGEPEATSSLGKGFCRGGCRNHDLLLEGEDCVIGIEAKVTEPFDNPIGKVIEDQKNSGKKTKAETETRGYKLFHYLTGKDKLSGEDNKLMYQLFTATRGTIKAAKKKQAIMLVIQLIPDRGDKSNKIQDNLSAFRKFISAINISETRSRESLSCFRFSNNGDSCWLCDYSVHFKERTSK